MHKTNLGEKAKITKQNIVCLISLAFNFLCDLGPRSDIRRHLCDNSHCGVSSTAISQLISIKVGRVDKSKM
jgi:hypothetical protein